MGDRDVVGNPTKSAEMGGLTFCGSKKGFLVTVSFFWRVFWRSLDFDLGI